MTDPAVDKKVQGETKDQPTAIEEVVGTLIDSVEALTKRIDALEKTSVKKSAGLFGGKREKTAIKDTKTGTIYPSKASVGKNLAGEFKLDVTDNFAWYKIISQAPDRFVAAGEEEAAKAWAEQEAQLQKSVDEANKKIAADEAAKKGKGK